MLRAGYNGYGRGLLTELLNLSGAVTATALTINYAGFISQLLQPWVWWGPTITAFLAFWGLLISLILLVHVVLRRMTEIIKFERVHWITQTIGLILGGARGVWWSAFVLVCLASSGFAYMRESVEDRSVIGSRMGELSQTLVMQVADRFPGAKARGEMLVPPLKPVSNSQNR
jgi:uncharacterized membrane protein required for colicin V production